MHRNGEGSRLQAAHSVDHTARNNKLCVSSLFSSRV